LTSVLRRAHELSQALNTALTRWVEEPVTS
jgi:hypothetical protein